MHISYQKVIFWLRNNFKILMMIEVLCLFSAVIYLNFAPRIYEASFSLRLPKVPSTISVDSPITRLQLLVSPQEFIRPTQNPMAYSSQFILDCMGEDTNANRKKFINALQLGVQQQGDVIAFNLRLEGRERVVKCANLMLEKTFNNLVQMQENYLQSFNQNKGPELLNSLEKQGKQSEIKKPEVEQAIRISDSYVKPEISRVLTGSILLGFFLTVFASVMRARYRA
jgi:uncharacterized protein involved in exopolysaccharide biosynthesis